ncbi:fibronectin type III domain-containing protein [Krasilnikovia sp. MM14-A1259]|uniref:fibronectin type III domain-containing protein n=1 Tax=Krasilnikovia sp. MM14-A1259 TaxID=3373539 RepID=UPI00399D0FE9
MVISVRTAARIAYADRVAQYAVLGYDAPFIWFALHEKLSCDGTKRATVTYSDFPGITVYANNNQVVRDEQSVELRRFISNGGQLPTALTPGVGRFDPICRTYAVNAPGYTVPTIPSRPLSADCKEGKETGWLLNRTDYAVSLYVNSGLASGGNIAPVAPTPPTTPTPPAVPLPGVPQGVRVTGTSISSISLAWNTVAGATSYRVYEGTTQVASTSGTAVTVSGLASGSTHTYTVRAVNAAGLSGPSAAVAATTQLWAYNVVSQKVVDSSGQPVDLGHARPGQRFTVTMTLANAGNTTWTPGGTNPVRLGTDEPRDHTGTLQAPGWVSPTRPAGLPQASVPPGGQGTFQFPITAPEAVDSSASRTVREAYRPVVEGTTWMSGPGISITMTVVPVTGGAIRPGFGQQQWTVASDGGVFAYAGAPFFGSMGGKPLNAPMVGMAATPSGNGYWLVGADGGVFNYGDAVFAGSMGGKPLNRPVVGITGTPSGRGYWLVAADGGVFNYGDALFYGSMGGSPLNAPVVGIAATPSGRGYWLTAADGGVFAYGDAVFAGSMVGKPMNGPVVGISAAPGGRGYWLAGRDGGVFAFGTAPFVGSLGQTGSTRPIVTITPTQGGYVLIDRTGQTSFFTSGAPVNRSRLYPGEMLFPNERLVSANGRYVLVMQGDGNLVEYDGGTPVWASNTAGVGASTFEAQRDGNFVVYAAGHRAVWATGTNRPDSMLTIQDDRNVVVYAPGNLAVWANNRGI